MLRSKPVREFDEIYRTFHKPIQAYMRQRIGDAEVAQELTQDVFLKVHRYQASYNPQYQFSTWLWTIARNTLADWYRQKPAVTETLAAEEVASRDPDPEKLLLRGSKRKILLYFFKQLTSLQRRVVWMRVIHQLSNEEIARKLDMSISAVKCAAYRARIILTDPHLQAVATLLA